ncbi:MAG: hypothetical protein J1F39_01760 [Clostridiales bacterium]|nr:hypothetical protein [Clostridiales bacterium]
MEENNSFNYKDNKFNFGKNAETIDSPLKDDSNNLTKAFSPSAEKKDAKPENTEKPKSSKARAVRGEPNDPVSIPVAVIIALLYAAAAVICVLSLTTDIISGLFSQSDSFTEESAQAFSRLYGYMILVLIPSIFILVANKAPINMTTGLRVLFWIIGVLGMAGLIVLFFYISGQPEYKALLGDTNKDLYGILWLRVSTIVAAVGALSINILANLEPNFNLDNAFASFLDGVWMFAQGQISLIIFTVLSFSVLPWAFLIIPVAGIMTFVLVTTLVLYLMYLTNDDH